VPPEATARLLITEPDRFNSILSDIPWANDIWQVRRYDVDDTRKVSDLHQLLRDELRGFDWVTAGKLLAPKRPRLIPILDKEVQSFLAPQVGRFWVSMYDQLADK